MRIPIPAILAFALAASLLLAPGPAVAQSTVVFDVDDQPFALEGPPAQPVTLAPVGVGSTAYTSSGGELVSEFPSRADYPRTFATPNGETLAITTDSLVVRDATGAVLRSESPTAAAPTATGTELTYAGVFAGATDLFSVTSTSVKHDLKLATIPALPGAASTFGARYRVEVSAGTELIGLDDAVSTVGRTAESLNVVSHDGTPIFELPRIVMIDADSETTYGTYRIEVVNGTTFVTVEVPVADLQAAAYPVRIDPTVTYLGQNSTNIFPWSSSTSYLNFDVQTNWLPQTQLQGETGSLIEWGPQMTGYTSRNYRDFVMRFGETTKTSGNLDFANIDNNFNVSGYTEPINESSFNNVGTNTSPYFAPTQVTGVFYSGQNALMIHISHEGHTGGTGADGWRASSSSGGAVYDNFRLFRYDRSTGSTYGPANSSYYTHGATFTFQDEPIEFVSPTDPILPGGYETEAYPEVEFVAEKGAPPYSWAADGLPAGLQLEVRGNSAFLVGTPEVGTAGTHQVEITVSDSLTPPGTDSRTYELFISESLKLLNKELGTWAERFYNEIQFIHSGGLDPVTWTIDGLPDGVSYEAATGLVKGTPFTGTAGRWDVEIVLEDSNNRSITAYTTLIVVQQPRIRLAQLADAVVGELYAPVIITIDGGAPPVEITVTGLPAGMTAIDGVITGIPANGTGGQSFTVRIQARDGFGASDDEILTLHVLSETSVKEDGSLAACSPGTSGNFDIASLLLALLTLGTLLAVRRRVG
jgi:hypothetical protein